MNEILYGLRVSAEEIKNHLIEKQKENNVSNDAMCVILRDILGYFEAQRSNDYAQYILGQSQMFEALKKELERAGDNDKSDNKP